MTGHSIQAVIWDYGGVITTSPFEAFARFECERGLPDGLLRRVNAANHLDNAWARFERSQLDIDGFDQAFAAECAALGHSVRGRDVVAVLGGSIRPAMVEALRRLRPRLKIGLITNNVRTTDPDGFDEGGRSEILTLFHHVIESAKAGVRKPDPAIYKMMCEALGVAPAQTVFLDDLGVNLKPARALGMHTIKVDDPDEALQQLEALVGFALRDGPATSAHSLSPV
ncbi:MAG: HAD-IA family hydrolase [Burkholderiales bacterium]